MSKNEELHEMRAQILNLRSAGITLATAIHHFPPCGRPGSCNRKCPEAGLALQEIYKSMSDLMLSVRLFLTVVFHHDPEPWDLLCILNAHGPQGDRDTAELGRSFFLDQHEFIRFWGEMDDEMMDRLGTGFSEKEWKRLTAKRAWQHGPRLYQILTRFKYLEDQIREQCDLYESVLHSGLLGNCKLGQWAAQRKAAQA
jgi:hypothetical protein